MGQGWVALQSQLPSILHWLLCATGQSRACGQLDHSYSPLCHGCHLGVPPCLEVLLCVALVIVSNLQLFPLPS